MLIDSRDDAEDIDALMSSLSVSWEPISLEESEEEVILGKGVKGCCGLCGLCMRDIDFDEVSIKGNSSASDSGGGV
jgi:hypothetical protein